MCWHYNNWADAAQTTKDTIVAEKNELVPVYDGVVSEERPYRREVANAVFEYVEYLIKKRG